MRTASCLALAALVGLAASSDVPTRHELARTRAYMIPGMGQITALDAGDAHIYACTQEAVVQLLRSTMTVTGRYELAANGMQDTVANVAATAAARESCSQRAPPPRAAAQVVVMG